MQAQSGIDLKALLENPPLLRVQWIRSAAIALTFVGLASFGLGLLYSAQERVWTAFLTNAFFWLGLSYGSVTLCAVAQIVRARWSAPVRRVAEASGAFLPLGALLFLMTWFGREILYPWGRAPMPGREWWMQPAFVYLRAAALLALLAIIARRFIALSLRSDVGLLRDRFPARAPWNDRSFDALAAGWRGAAEEVPATQRRLSRNAPIIVLVGAVVISLLSFDMVMAMDVNFYSNLFGGWIFIGNFYLALAALTVTVTLLVNSNAVYRSCVAPQHFWDIGKLTFGFCMLWAYLFFSQFLPTWYANLPETAPWMVIRTREMPWKAWAWFSFACCFIFPFILLLSRDVKRTAPALSLVACIIVAGVWCERYLEIAPQLFPADIPFGVLEICLTMGFAGLYTLTIVRFLERYPLIPLSHPLIAGSADW